MTVGLLGGSFDPPHAGHVHITRESLKRFDLDRVVWLVSPGNPLKSRGPAPLYRRMAVARDIMRHPRVVVSDFEAQVGTRYTAETLAQLLRRYPGVRFVWLMGADNLAQLHRWDRWEDIVHAVPLGVLARPGDRIASRLGKAARMYANARLPGRFARALPWSPPPRWCYVSVPLVAQSSTDIRAAGNWPDHNRE